MSQSNRSPQLRFGILGLGAIGQRYMRHLTAGAVVGAKVVAASDLTSECEAEALTAGIAFFPSAGAMFASGDIDSVIITTPAYCRADLVDCALHHGLGVVADKPVALHLADAERLETRVGLHIRPVSVMFNHRTDPAYQFVRELLLAGSLGELVRVSWYISHYFRTNAYYSASPWRGTWAGEGGGVLMNQCHHQIDLFNWLFGLPLRVRAFARTSERRDIEVDDSVTAYMLLPGGCEATLVASTHDFPRRDRLEIVGTRGYLLKEYGHITLGHFSCDTGDMIRRAPNSSTKVEPTVETQELDFPDNGTQHAGVLRNHVEAFNGCAALIANWSDGIRALHLSNALAHSAYKDCWVDLPLNATEFACGLQLRIATSTSLSRTAAD